MSTLFVVEDEFHAEWQGKYLSFNEAVGELKRRAALPWDQTPNRCPCTSWETCHRDYQIIEFDRSADSWKEIRRVGLLEVSHTGAIWSGELGAALEGGA